MSLKGRIAVLESDHPQFRLPQHPPSLYAGEALKANRALINLLAGMAERKQATPGENPHSSG
jgi:hypothetical protein